jgi:hypothetical protein
MSAMRGPGAVRARGTSRIDQLRGTVDLGHSYFRNSSQAIIVEPEVIAIVVAPVAGKRGFFEARLAEGEPVIAPSRTPFFDAARRLRDLGMDGAAVLAMRNADSNTECLRATIAVAATTTVEESAHGPVFRRQRASPPSAVKTPGMRSARPIEATTELAGANIVEESAHDPVFRRHRVGFGPGQTPREPLLPEAAAPDDHGLDIPAFLRRSGGRR